jgi:hypothetical protein
MPRQKKSAYEFGIGHDFANAVFYSLSDHPRRERVARGIIIPINEAVWKQVLGRVFPEEYHVKKPQKLAAYCSYFRLGKHGIGYDNRGRRDFALGTRVSLNDRGKQGRDVTNDPERAIWPSKGSTIEAAEVIRVAMDYMKTHHPRWAEARKKLVHVLNENNDDTVEDDVIIDPIRREIHTEAFERKAAWARLARKLYGYECMIPGCLFELIKENGEKYIEVHHIIAMFDHGSPNDKRNLSVLCPNHHREIHYGALEQRKKLTMIVRKEQARRVGAL